MPKKYHNRLPTKSNLQPTTYNFLKKTISTKRKKRIKECKGKFHILKNRLKPCGFSSKISTLRVVFLMKKPILLKCYTWKRAFFFSRFFLLEILMEGGSRFRRKYAGTFKNRFRKWILKIVHHAKNHHQSSQNSRPIRQSTLFCTKQRPQQR